MKGSERKRKEVKGREQERNEEISEGNGREEIR